MNLLICKEGDDENTHKNENHWLMRGPLNNQGDALLNAYMNKIIYTVGMQLLLKCGTILQSFSSKSTNKM